MTLDELLKLLDSTPAIADIHPVSISYLPADVVLLDSAAKAAWLLDDPKPTLPTRLLIKPPVTGYDGRFPHVKCSHDPFTSELNAFLFERFDTLASSMLCQSQLAAHIADHAAEQDVIVLYLLDGLSYQDICSVVPRALMHATVEPCLVDVPTLTRLAFPNIIGSPALALRLFNAGYHHRLGFTYWSREDNQLTDILFSTITDVKKVADFTETLATLRDYWTAIGHRKSYVQILRTGLDSYAHGQRRRPPVAAIVDEIVREFGQLALLCAELFGESGLKCSLYLTADHGILWLDEFQPEIVGEAPANTSARYCGWRELYYQHETGRRFLTRDEELYCLGFPKLRRPLRLDEQGIHGGISFQESVVPFVRLRVGD